MAGCLCSLVLTVLVDLCSHFLLVLLTQSSSIFPLRTIVFMSFCICVLPVAEMEKVISHGTSLDVVQGQRHTYFHHTQATPGNGMKLESSP